MRVLITGGAGFIGSHLAEAYLARGDEVYILDDLSTGTLENLRHHQCPWSSDHPGTLQQVQEKSLNRLHV